MFLKNVMKMQAFLACLFFCIPQHGQYLDFFRAKCENQIWLQKQLFRLDLSSYMSDPLLELETAHKYLAKLNTCSQQCHLVYFFSHKRTEIFPVPVKLGCLVGGKSGSSEILCSDKQRCMMWPNLLPVQLLVCKLFVDRILFGDFFQ